MRDMLVVYFAYLVSDVMAAIHIRALVNGPVGVAIVSVAALHFLGFLPAAWFADRKDTKQRLFLTAAAAAGAATGTAVVMIGGL